MEQPEETRKEQKKKKIISSHPPGLEADAQPPHVLPSRRRRRVARQRLLRLWNSQARRRPELLRRRRDDVARSGERNRDLCCCCSSCCCCRHSLCAALDAPRLAVEVVPQQVAVVDRQGPTGRADAALGAARGLAGLPGPARDDARPVGERRRRVFFRRGHARDTAGRVAVVRLGDVGILVDGDDRGGAALAGAVVEGRVPASRFGSFFFFFFFFFFRKGQEKV